MVSSKCNTHGVLATASSAQLFLCLALLSSCSGFNIQNSILEGQGEVHGCCFKHSSFHTHTQKKTNRKPTTTKKSHQEKDTAEERTICNKNPRGWRQLKLCCLRKWHSLGKLPLKDDVVGGWILFYTPFVLLVNIYMYLKQYKQSGKLKQNNFGIFVIRMFDRCSQSWIWSDIELQN